jgi:hypothetical protein
LTTGTIKAPLESHGDAQVDVRVVVDGAAFESDALTMGKRRSASMAAAAMNGM